MISRLLYLVLLAGLFGAQFARADGYVLSAPPLQDAARDRALFEPVAAWLSRVTGTPFRYEQARNWPAYLRNMQSARYDLLFDGSHLVGWRVERIEHTPLARFSESWRHVVVTLNSEEAPRLMRELEGRTVCSGALPGQDALTLMNSFSDSWNPPLIKPVRDYAARFDAMTAGECVAAVLPRDVYRALATASFAPPTRTIHTSRPVPGRSFSASPRVPADLRDAIRVALTSEEAGEVLAPLAELHRQPLPLVAADIDEYRGLSDALAGLWGF